MTTEPSRFPEYFDRAHDGGVESDVTPCTSGLVRIASQEETFDGRLHGEPLVTALIYGRSRAVNYRQGESTNPFGLWLGARKSLSSKLLQALKHQDWKSSSTPRTSSPSVGGAAV
jgi:hypothetical protein